MFEVLRKDHEEVKRALAELERGPTAASGANPDQLTLREKLVEELTIEESKHEAVEEEYFWPAVRDHLEDGDALADHAIEQEVAAKFVLNDLIGMKTDDPQFEELVGRFITDGREHIAYEEDNVWPAMEKALSAEEAEELGHKVEEGKKIAPTRPHPHTPPKPGILKAAGPAVAAADRVRDAATGRGQD
ncbi:hemerythrin domain-containing protein [Actinoallomurus iriomotensis]|uniref:hemerythrin domain-containing protein n=1 Tax=Actinoallomurus iriomotensis TaxID=478107 RepID=UPI002553A5B2|nr:hemerythrin domain-containing protein [Actinoallomurus iriomotensis]